LRGPVVGDGDTVAPAATRAFRGMAAGAAAPLTMAGDEPNTVVTSSSHVRLVDKEYRAGLPFTAFFTSVTVSTDVHTPTLCRFHAVLWSSGYTAAIIQHTPRAPSRSIKNSYCYWYCLPY